mmetsp:Transcript_122445/g.193960  ORF Transcript_122445/g.193960 Transcript_122445/m.193960 type:complete len:512 (+) Transcript_122445:59-1594(+)
MAPGKKQEARKANKQKEDDEPVVAGTSSKDAIISAGKELVLGSVLLEVVPKVAKLMKPGTKESPKTEASEEREENAEPATSTTNEPVKEDASALLEGLTQRLSAKNPLGIDKAPEETWELLVRQEIDFGPYKRKKGNPKTERIMVNFERNMVPYLHILLILMCMRALLLRSWFACLPWLIAYQFLAMYAPVDMIVDMIRENFPNVQEKIPPVEDKHRLVATISFHGLVWLFFVYEFGYKAYIFEKLLLILCLVGHAYIAQPIVDLEASRKAIAERKQQEDAAPDSSSKEAGSNSRASFSKVQACVQGSVLVKRTRSLPDLVKDIAASAKKASKSEEKKEDSSEKTETNQKTNGDENGFCEMQKELTPYNALGLASSPEEAKVAWKAFKSYAVHFEPPAKKSGAAKQRIMTNLEQFAFQYTHVLLGLMCLRAFLFRSWFACLPILVVCQIASLMLSLPTVDSKVRLAVSTGLHILMWFFFVYETAFMTHFLEKCFVVGIFVGHAYVAAPVVN